jgi:hypothetical protein
MNRARSPGLLDRHGRTEKQTDADRSANGDHLDVAVLEPTVEVFLRVQLLFVQRLFHLDPSHDPLCHVALHLLLPKTPSI